MANVVIDMQSGTVLEKAISPTSSTEPKDQETLNLMFSGVVGRVTPLATPALSGARLSDDERLKLAKIRRNRSQGWMPTFEEFDSLLAMVEKLKR